MKLIISQKNLEKALDITSNVSAKKVINPSLQGCFLNAHNNTLTIQSSDSEIFFSIQLSCEIIEEGSALVKSALLKDIIKNFSQEMVNLSIQNNSLLISSSQSQYKATLILLNHEEFPTFPEVNTQETLISLPSLQLKHMLTQTIPFAAKDDLRITFNSIFVDKKDIELRLVSSDTKRLAFTKEFLTQTQNSFHFLMPLKTASILKEMIFINTPINLSILNHMVSFQYENMILISNQVDGNFPDYRNVIPEQTPFLFSVNKETFLSALKTLSPFYGGDFQKITMSIQSGEMILETEKTEIGEAKNNVPIDYQGEPITIAFNYRYFQEILNNIEEKQILIKIASPEKPVLLEGEGNNKTLFVCVPMKMS